MSEDECFECKKEIIGADVDYIELKLKTEIKGAVVFPSWRFCSMNCLTKWCLKKEESK